MGAGGCIKSEPIALDSLKAKQRYRINKGLKLNHCRRCSNPEEIELNELTEMLEESFSDYPKVYKPKSNFCSYAKTILSQCSDNRYDVWLINSKQDSKLIGLGVCRLEQDIVVLQVAKVRPSLLKDEVNAALAYTLCNYYLESNKYKYITDGERNIRHKSNYQDFLVNVLGFRRLYCNLHIVYHPFVAPFVKILYPFRKLIHWMEDCNSFIYNISCVLKQEEIAKATYCK